VWLAAGVMIPEASTALGKDLAMQAPHIVQLGRPDGSSRWDVQMGLELLSHSRRQHRAAILPALAMAHRDLRALNIKVLHPGLIQSLSPGRVPAGAAPSPEVP
jgi:hypothetical protein